MLAVLDPSSDPSTHIGDLTTIYNFSSLCLACTHTHPHPLALYSDLSGQLQSRVNYCPEMPQPLPSCLSIKDIFKWRENNVFPANVFCICCSLPHTHDVALRVLLQVGLDHPGCVLQVSHDSARRGRCGQDWPSPVSLPALLREG